MSETSTRAGLRVVHVTDPTDDRLADYNRLTDVALRSKHEPEKGLYIAESSTVIRRALAAGHRPRSFLMAERWLDDLADDIAALPVDDAPGGTGEQVPVYVGAPDVLEAITGFHLHRGALAAMHRPPLAPVRDLLSAARGGTGARRVAVLEDVVDHTNVGAVFRSAAALGVDAVLVSPRCADPLYRRSVRVSMGTVFQVPWTRFETWPGGLDLLRDEGFVVAALALADDAVSLDEVVADPPERLALVLGTEGDGLSRGAIEAADRVVTIPMAGEWTRSTSPRRRPSRSGRRACPDLPGVRGGAAGNNGARRRVGPVSVRRTRRGPVPVQPSPSLPDTTPPDRVRDVATHAVDEEQQHLDAALARRAELLAELDAQLAAPADDVADRVPAAGRVEAETVVERARRARLRRRRTELERAGSGLVFGRLDTVEGVTRRVGRVGIAAPDGDADPLVLDWRADGARPFYTATAREPQGLALRRHVRTTGSGSPAWRTSRSTARGGAVDEDGLVGEGALLAALSERRTGRMGTAVATLQVEQDAIVRAPAEQTLVVQGGPGTGKTVVALHRVAYLLFTHPHLAERGPPARAVVALPRVRGAGAARARGDGGRLGDVRHARARRRAGAGRGARRRGDQGARAVARRRRPVRGRPRPGRAGPDGPPRRRAADARRGPRRRGPPCRPRRRSERARRAGPGRGPAARRARGRGRGTPRRAARPRRGGVRGRARKLDAGLAARDDRAPTTGARGGDVDGELTEDDLDRLRDDLARDAGFAAAVDAWWPVVDARAALADLLGDAALLARHAPT